jgi:hypothetical protein
MLLLDDIDWGMGSRRAGVFPMIGEGIFTQDGPHVRTIDLFLTASLWSIFFALNVCIRGLRPPSC